MTRILWRAHFKRKAARELHDARLGGRIGRDIARDAQPEDRGDVDDRAAAPFRHHPRGCGLRHAKHAGEIGVDHAAPILRRARERLAVMAHAGIVDDDIESARAAGLGHGSRIGDIEARGFHRPARLPDGIRGILQHGLAPRRECHGGTGARQHLGEMPPETGGCAGDERAFAREAQDIIHASALFASDFPAPAALGIIPCRQRLIIGTKPRPFSASEDTAFCDVTTSITAGALASARQQEYGAPCGLEPARLRLAILSRVRLPVPQGGKNAQPFSVALGWG